MLNKQFDYVAYDSVAQNFQNLFNKVNASVTLETVFWAAVAATALVVLAVYLRRA